MYNKISSIILNSGKSSGFSDVFIAQPDSLKEGLAGKVFIVAEIGAKKNEAKKIFEFLIDSLDENYYDDEKILLRDKIEGLKVENIFEAAIAKTNKSLAEFLLTNKIKINPSLTNISLGVVFENNLYFSTYGRNRAFLIYKQKDQYEIINVEANASDTDQLTPHDRNSDKASFPPPAFFSSVISGSIPTASYFIFTSEALPEYISSRDLIGIITKLPPIVAAEQIKNILSKINSFVPFLGIIIKNTLGLDKQEVYEEIEENLSAHSSISSLNHTEERTEQMLEPAGLINFSKFYKNLQRFIKGLGPKKKHNTQKIKRLDSESSDKIIDNNINNQGVDLGKINSLGLAKANTFLVKEKMIFKRRPNLFNFNISRLSAIVKMFNVEYFRSLANRTKALLRGLSRKNRLLLIFLIGALCVFIMSVTLTNWSKKQTALKNNYNNLVISIKEKQSGIDQFLLYDNEVDANKALKEAWELLGYLPQDKKGQIEVYSELESDLKKQADKIQKMVKVDKLEQVNDLSGLQISNIVFVDNKIYANSSQKIYEITPQSSESAIFEITGSASLSNPQFDSKSIIYYWDNDKVIKFDLKTKKSTPLAISEELALQSASYKIYGSNLYTLARDSQQVYKSILSGSSYKTRSAWLKENVDLSNVADFFINGNIYLLKNNGQILNFRLGKAEEYKSNPVSPEMFSASKLIIGSELIYVFEADTSRLAILALKDGHLMSQYQITASEKLKDFAIDEVNKIAYFLADDRIYKINLNR